jgi:hypothetical protein
VHEREEPATDYVLLVVLFVAFLVLWPPIAFRRGVCGCCCGMDPLSEVKYTCSLEILDYTGCTYLLFCTLSLNRCRRWASVSDNTITISFQLHRTAIVDKALFDWSLVEHATKGSNFVHSRQCDFANLRHLLNNLFFTYFLLLLLPSRYYVIYPKAARLRVRTVLDV